MELSLFEVAGMHFLFHHLKKYLNICLKSDNNIMGFKMQNILDMKIYYSTIVLELRRQGYP